MSPWTTMRRATATTAAAAAVVLGLAAPAAAATGNVTLSYGNYNCAKGGSVTGVLASIDRGGQNTAWDWGDGRTTLWSQLNVRVQINATLYCQRPWHQGGGYYVYSVYRTAWPSFSGQTIHL